MFKKIYLDLDGVVADFDTRFLKVNGIMCGTQAAEDNWPVYWNRFVKGKNFEDLGWQPGGEHLVESLVKLGVPVEILTSAGGSDHYEDVRDQKLKWLASKQIPFKANIVESGKLKRDFATPDSVLIDDTQHVIDYFAERGGLTILHTKASKTLEELLVMTNQHINMFGDELC